MYKIFNDNYPTYYHKYSAHCPDSPMKVKYWCSKWQNGDYGENNS